MAEPREWALSLPTHQCFGHPRTQSLIGNGSSIQKGKHDTLYTSYNTVWITNLKNIAMASDQGRRTSAGSIHWSADHHQG